MLKFFSLRRPKEKTYGTAQGRHYDIPLHEDPGAGFLRLLIGMMSFLAFLALAGFFALSAMTSGWTAGLKDGASVEIQGSAAHLPDAVLEFLDRQNIVKEAWLLPEAEVAALVEPWLGDADALPEDFPLPRLISISFHGAPDAEVLEKLAGDLKSINSGIRLETHERWRNDLMRLTGALQLAALAVLCTTGLIAAIAVAAAVQARMDVHKAEVSLLHLMGADDLYIVRQFQRHILILALQGAIAGVLTAAAILFLMNGIAGEAGANLLPGYKSGGTQLTLIGLLPVAAVMLAVVAARRTVFRFLAAMP